MPLNTYVHPPPPLPCPVFADFCYLGFTVRNSEGKEYMFMCDKGGWPVVYTGRGGVPIPHYIFKKSSNF
jgi:hypothetical protein